MTIRLSGGDARSLESFCRTQLRWDAGLAARVVTTPRAVGVFTVPPLGVLAFAAVPAAGIEEPVDATVPLAALADLLAAEDGAIDVTALPRAIVRPGPSPSLGVLPPADGWQLPIHAVSGDLVPTVDAARAEFAERGAGLRAPEQEELAEEIWSRPAFGGLPLRALHAARALGMLGTDMSRVSASTSGQWRRLATVRGQVFTYAMGPASRLALRVVH